MCESNLKCIGYMFETHTGQRVIRISDSNGVGWYNEMSRVKIRSEQAEELEGEWQKIQSRNMMVQSGFVYSDEFFLDMAELAEKYGVPITTAVQKEPKQGTKLQVTNPQAVQYGKVVTFLCVKEGSKDTWYVETEHNRISTVERPYVKIVDSD